MTTHPVRTSYYAGLCFCMFISFLLAMLITQTNAVSFNKLINKKFTLRAGSVELMRFSKLLQSGSLHKKSGNLFDVHENTGEKGLQKKFFAKLRDIPVYSLSTSIATSPVLIDLSNGSESPRKIKLFFICFEDVKAFRDMLRKKKDDRNFLSEHMEALSFRTYIVKSNLEEYFKRKSTAMKHSGEIYILIPKISDLIAKENPSTIAGTPIWINRHMTSKDDADIKIYFSFDQYKNSLTQNITKEGFLKRWYALSFGRGNDLLAQGQSTLETFLQAAQRIPDKQIAKIKFIPINQYTTAKRRNDFIAMFDIIKRFVANFPLLSGGIGTLSFGN